MPVAISRYVEHIDSKHEVILLLQMCLQECNIYWSQNMTESTDHVDSKQIYWTCWQQIGDNWRNPKI